MYCALYISFDFSDFGTRAVIPEISNKTFSWHKSGLENKSENLTISMLDFLKYGC